MDSNRRITEKLLRYWLKTRGNKPYPKESDIDFEELSDIWDNCFLVQVFGKNSKPPYKYTYLGKDLIAAYGGDITSDEVSKTIVSPYTKRVQKKFEELLKSKKPVSDDAEYVDSKKLKIKYRQVLVPLGNEKGDIEYILGGMRWKPFI